MTKIVFLLALLSFYFGVYGQIGITGPEQDCVGAIHLCGSIYTNNSSYSGHGAVRYEVPRTSCLENGENNSVWYAFEIDSPGLLNFLIIPLDSFDDYDFALYNVTGHNCADIPTGIAPEVRCNYALGPGLTTGLAGTGSQTQASANGDAILASLQVQCGDQFRLVVDNFNTAMNSGFTIDFSASTAHIGTACSPPTIINQYDTLCAFNSEITLTFSNPLICNSISTNGSGFQIQGASGLHIIHADAVDCYVPNSSAYQVLLQFNDTLPVDSDFDIILNAGAISGLCNLPTTNNDTLHIHVKPAPKAGFSFRLVDDSILLIDSTLNADTVYYELNNGTTIHPIQGNATNILLPRHGTYQLCQYVKGCNTPAVCRTINYITGINEPGNTDNILISPNPTFGRISIQIPKENYNSKIVLYNILGQPIIENEVATGVTQSELDLTNLASGPYILVVKQSDTTFTKKVIKY